MSTASRPIDMVQECALSASNKAILAERLERLGMPMEGERLERTARLGMLYSSAPHELHDLLLMGIAVEADHRADAEAPIWV